MKKKILTLYHRIVSVLILLKHKDLNKANYTLLCSRCFWLVHGKKKPVMVWHHEVEGKWENGKYSSVVTKTLMTMNESVNIIVAKF